MFDAGGIEVASVGKAHFQHHLLPGRQSPDALHQPFQQHLFGRAFGLAVNVDFWFEDRHQACRDNLLSDLELLVDDGRDARFIGSLDYGTHLCPEYLIASRLPQQFFQAGHRLHHLYSILFLFEPPVYLEKGHHPLLLPQVVCRTHAADGSIHCVFKEDRSQYAVASETGAGDDACAHLVNPIKHLLVIRIVGCADSIKVQRFGRAAPALIKSSNEAVFFLDFFKLLVKCQKSLPN